MSDINSKIAEFCSLTEVDEDRARFYIEAAGGDIALALESFFDDDNGPHLPMEEPHNEPILSGNRSENVAQKKNEVEVKGRAEEKKSKTNQKIFTLAGLNSNENDEESNSDEEGQAFYAGGSTTSGQQILGPSKKDPSKIVDHLFKKAKESGAREASMDETEDVVKKADYSSISGYRLGDGSGQSEYFKGQSHLNKKKVVVLRLWKNGFTTDGATLRNYTDPQNQKFLQSIQSGLIPDELLKQRDGSEVHLDMEDHRDEEFIPPKPAYVLFNNEGYKLGSPTPKVTVNASPNDLQTNEVLAKTNLNVDETQPTTLIQVRLSDGSKLTVKANQTHKISDLRNYIKTSRPEYQTARFALLTNFPSKELVNENENLKEANLLNSVIIQKLV